MKIFNKFCKNREKKRDYQKKDQEEASGGHRYRSVVCIELS